MEVRESIEELPETGFVRLLGLFKNNLDMKTVIQGPIAGGTFWALASCNDLPLYTEGTRSVHLTHGEFFNHFDVYMRKADVFSSKWCKINYLTESAYKVTYEESWDSDQITANYVNGLPEFYCIKKG